MTFDPRMKRMEDLEERKTHPKPETARRMLEDVPARPGKRCKMSAIGKLTTSKCPQNSVIRDK